MNMALCAYYEVCSNSIFPLLADAAQIIYPCMQCAEIFFLKRSIYRAIAFHGIPKEILLNSLSSERLLIFPF